VFNNFFIKFIFFHLRRQETIRFPLCGSEFPSPFIFKELPSLNSQQKLKVELQGHFYPAPCHAIFTSPFSNSIIASNLKFVKSKAFG
jgi:hypothetical protein